MKALFDSPVGRLVGRAVIVFLSVTAGQLQVADEPFGKAALTAAVTAGITAAFEVFTPLNRVVGVGKKPS